MKRPIHLSDLRAYSRLAVEATIGVTDLVEAVHRSVVSLPGRGAKPTRTRGLTGFIYRAIRWITLRVGGGLDSGLAQLTPMLAPGSADAGADGVTLPPPEREALVAALNGVLGDHLEASANPLAISMRFRRGGQVVDPASQTGSRVLLLLHGLCMNDLQWRRRGHDHGERLADELGFTAVYLHYNSGRSISSNGRELSDQLEVLLRAWPQPVTELVAVGHSMGGLVIRSACDAADAAEAHDLLWRRLLTKIVFLGTPHQGSPVERGGNWLNRALDTTSYTAAFGHLGRLRSVGITDLRHGLSSPLPAGVECYAAAAVLGRATDPAAAAIGDGLVPLLSALGDSSAARRWIGSRMSHLDLLDRREVYDQLRVWLQAPAPGAVLAR